MSRYAVAKIPTPILNTPDFNEVFGKEYLPLDEVGLLRPVEMIALPGTKFTIINQINTWIVEVKTIDYPFGPLYVDTRFLSSCSKNTPERPKNLPHSATILDHLFKSLGLPYIWGGNYGKGIPQIVTFYQGTKIDDKKLPLWTLQGVDCSGLLYEATAGYTPRNTSQLIHFGSPLLIEGLRIKDILIKVLPLDLIIHKGHVIIVLDEMNTIESAHSRDGVVLTNLEQRLEQLMVLENKIPVNTWDQKNLSSFVIRRFVGI